METRLGTCVSRKVCFKLASRNKRFRFFQCIELGQDVYSSDFLT